VSPLADSGIRIDDVWKAYRHWPSGSRTVRGVLSRRVPLVARRDERYALRGVGFHVHPGEMLGVIGPNGAGKSTLLRLASGLGRPSRGAIEVPEPTVGVLSLGDTVDLSLTGRENAMTAAIVGGMSRREAKASMPAVFEFAELEDYSDAPVRTYSEGMKLRLAFGVVAQLEPEALLIDEVLSVGDLRFQAKCANRVKQLQERGTAVLMTSHYLDQVAEECDRVLWLQSGSVRMLGETGEVIAAYEDEMRSQTVARTPAGGQGSGDLELRRNRFGSQEVTVEAVGLGGPSGPANEVRSGDPLTVTARVTSRASEPIDVHVAVAVRRASDGLVAADATSERGGLRLRLEPGETTTVAAAFTRLDLVPGEYGVDVGVYETGWAFAYDFHWSAYPLRVGGEPGGEGVIGAPVRWEAEGS
jgi:lipopolysaccharide transport system ATP-binding protein